MTLIKLTGKKPLSFKLPELLKDIFPDKHHYLSVYFNDVIKLSFPNNIMIRQDELNQLMNIMTITSLSYDKDMNRIVIMGYFNGE